MKLNQLEEFICTSPVGSAMFGPKGAENLRNGPPELRQPRTMGAGWLLYAFVRAVMPDTILEVGMGGSTFCMLHALRHNGKGHLHEISYDPAMGIQDFKINERFKDLPEYYHKDGTPFTIHEAGVFEQIKKQRFEDLITVQLGKSSEYGPKWNTPIDILAVDSSHLTEDTKVEVDLIKWLKPGGYAFFHDFTVCAHEVGCVVEDYVNAHNDLSMIVEPDYLSMAIIQRKFTFTGENTHFMSGGESDWYFPDKNPQAYDNEVQSTDGRGGGWIDEWRGRYIPEVEDWNKDSEALREAGIEFLESGKPQTTENIRAAIKKVKGK